MKKEDLQYFEALINEKLKVAKAELDSIREEIENSEEGEAGSFTEVFNLQTKYIKSLEQALIRIKNGTFGICKETGEEIDIERLKSVPNSNMSIFAKNVFNKEERDKKTRRKKSDDSSK